MSGGSPSIFARIARGEIPAQRVYETDQVLAFLDIAPLSPGHVLLIPKEPIETLDAATPEQAGALGAALPRLVRAVQEATGAAGVNVLQNNGTAAGQLVPHVHFHIIPRFAGDGLGFRWNAGTYGPGEAEAMREKIARLMRDA